MCVGLSWCLLQFADVTCMKCRSLGLWFLLLANIDVTHMIHTQHRLCMHALENSTFGFLMSLSKCSQTLIDAWWPLLMLPFPRQRRLVDSLGLKIMSHHICNYATTNACKPWLMFPFIDRCRLVDACRSGIMSPFQFQHAIVDAYISWQLLLAIWWSWFPYVCRP